MTEIENLVFSYRRKKRLFNDLSLELTPGNIYGLLGKNGAGKTTLLKIIAGLLFPDQGTSTVEDIPSSKCDPLILKDIYFIVEEFELDKDDRLHSMSYGKKKKYLLAFEHASRCKFLILDEGQILFILMECIYLSV